MTRQDVRIWAVPWLFGVVLGALILLPPPFASAQGGRATVPAARQAIIIVADKLAMEDFTDFPDALKPLAERIPAGAMAMMNVRTKSAANSANGYLSLALGERAAAGKWAGRGLMTDETHQGASAHELYQGLTGDPAHGAIVHLGIGELQRDGWGKGGTKPLGALLKDAGLDVALYGNGDVPGEKRRYAALLAMDDEGIVLQGDVSAATLVADPLFSGGRRTDYDKLAERVRAHLSPAEGVDVVVVDLGDLARLEDAASFLSDERALELRRITLERLASFTVDVIDAEASERSRVVYLVSPSPSTMLDRAGTLLTPVLRWHVGPGAESGSGQAPTGLLTSATTRRDGIVTNGDFLPSVLNDLGVEAKAASGGRRWRVVAHPDALSALLDRYHEIKSVHRQRLPVIQPYFLTLLALLFLGAALIVLTRRGLIRGTRKWASLWRLGTTAFLAFPAALLLLSLFPQTPLPMTWALVLVSSLALTLLAARFTGMRGTGPAGLLGAITAGLLVVDVALGAPLMQKSLLGYDPVAGSRYYGIGNEYMGVLFGAALMACGWISDGRRKERGVDKGAGRLFPWIVLGLFLAITLLMIHPRLGINVGGAITGACTGVAALLFLSKRPFTLKSAVASGSAVLVVVAATALLDSYLLGEEASHLGQVVQTINDSGSDPLWALFGRKAAVNLRLIRLTVWSRVVFVAFGFLVAAVFTPNWFHRELARRFPGLVDMTKTSVIASLVALVVNDSGVVAASTLLLWPVLTVLSVSPEVAQPFQRLP